MSREANKEEQPPLPVHDVTKPASHEEASWITKSPRSLLRARLPGHTHKSSLTRIYSPPEQSIPLTSEGIVVQALSVVSDSAAMQAPMEEPQAEADIKKISKRRRRANGEVDVEHTKSSPQFLHKLQQTLVDSPVESSEEESPEEDEFASDRESDDELEAVAAYHASNSLLRNTVQYTTESKNHLSQQQEAGGSRSRDDNGRQAPKYQSLLRNTVAYSTSSKHCKGNLGGEEEGSTNSKATESTVSMSLSSRSQSPFSSPRTSQNSSSSSSAENDLGYEDADKVMGNNGFQRVPGGARRRNSVTEHSLRLSATEAMATMEDTEQTRISLSITQIADKDATTTAPETGMQKYEQLARNAKSLLARSGRFGSLGNQNLGARKSALKSSVSSATATSTANPEGYGGMGMQGSTAQVNPYGYEDHNSISSQHAALGYENVESSSNDSNPYGYGDTTPQQSQTRERPWARRRGSVTKYSFAATSIVQAAEAMDTEQPIAKAFHEEDSFKPVLPTGENSGSNGASPKPGMQAPTKPMRKVSPWNAKGSSFATNVASSLAPPSVHAAPRAPPRAAASFRSESSYRSSRSGEAHYDSSSDDEDSDDDKSVATGSDESSRGAQSVTSITVPLKDCPSTPTRRDGPMRPPARSDSMRSFASRGSTRSARTMDSDDADSLAPDMKSLCSISQHERTVDRTMSGSAPPMFLPHTPTPESQLGKFRSPRKPARRTPSGDVGPSFPVETYVNTSPLPSPKIKHLQPRRKDRSINERIMAPSLDIDMMEDKSQP